MTLNLHITNPRHNPKVSEYVQARMASALGRFAESITSADVRLSDQNGPQGGDDKVCAIDVHLAPRGHQHVEARAAEVYLAIARAIRKMKTTLARLNERGQRGKAIRHAAAREGE